MIAKIAILSVVAALVSLSLLPPMPSSPNQISSSQAVLVVIVNQAWVASKFRTRLLQHLRDHGYRVVLLTDCSAGSFGLERVCDELVHVPLAATKVSPLADLRTLWTYGRQIRRARPLALLTFTIKPNLYGALAAHRSGVPVIGNVTGLGSASRSGGAVARIVAWLYKRALTRAHWVFFQNRQDADELVSRQLVPPGRWSVLPGSGVDTDRFRPVERPAGTARLRFCMVARLLRDKGVAEYAQAAALVSSSLKEVDFELWGILDASDPRCVTAEQVASWESQGVLRFHGEAPDANAAFADADVVVLPSYYPEGLPRTLLEAASMALPAITTDTPGCRDAVVDGVTGLLCRPRDVQGLADAMLKLAHMSAAQRAEIGQAARRRVVAEFDETLVLKAYVSQVDALRVRRGMVQPRPLVATE